MNYILKVYHGIALIGCLFFFSCKKDWLESKPEKALVVPQSISDYQALLDNAKGEENGVAMNSRQVILDELGAGDLVMPENFYNIISELEKNMYIWAGDIYGSDKNYSEWIIPYQRVFNTNIILEGIDKIKPTSPSQLSAWSQVKGSALFLRAYSHYEIAKEFCKPYNKNTASVDLGIPLRLQSDFSVKSIRSTVEQTYQQIAKDLKDAGSLLPILKPNNTLYKLRPTKVAADAMLARVYLSMSQYDSAFKYADLCLQNYNELIDYNSVPITADLNAFPAFNSEVIFHMESNVWYSTLSIFFVADTALYNSYENDDLRKQLYYNTNGADSKYKGHYTGTISYLFGGLATDEVILIRSESLARLGKVPEAMADLNSLMKKRWLNSVSYPTITASDQGDAIRKILLERRKELCFRGIRWSDLRRLNLEPSTAVTITKQLNGLTYTLAPNDPKYVLPIPTSVIELSGIEQNSR